MGGTRGLKSQEEPEVQNHRGHRAIGRKGWPGPQTLPASQPQSLKPSQHHIIKSKEASI